MQTSHTQRHFIIMLKNFFERLMNEFYMKHTHNAKCFMNLIVTIFVITVFFGKR